MALNIKPFLPLEHPDPSPEPSGINMATSSKSHDKEEREKQDRPHERPAYRVYQEALFGLDPFLFSRIRNKNLN